MENKDYPQQEDLDLSADPLTETPELEIIDMSADVQKDYVPRFLDQEPEAAPASFNDDVVHHDMLQHPEFREEITADEHAMAWHGMIHPSEPEPPFDMRVLDHIPDEEPEMPEEATAPILEEEPAFDETPAYQAYEEEAEPFYYDQEDAPQELPVEETALYSELSYEQPLPQESFRDEEFRDAFGDGEEFDEIFHAPAPEETIPTHDRPARKGRPRRKKGEFLFGLPHLAVTAVWMALIVVIGVTLGRMLWVCAADVLAFGRESKNVTVTIYESDTIDDIANKLHKGGLIRYPGLFKLYASFAVDEGEIAAGIWDLNTIYDYHALVNMMSPRSSREVIRVTIPEGYTCRQIFSLLEENKICTAIDLGNYAATGELDEYWFLEEVPRGDKYCLEGFLFPDTYDFYKNSTPREAIEKLLDGFAYRFTDEMRAQLETLNAEVTEGTFHIRDVVIVASLIEKETSSNEESPMIASVIYNRLFNWGNTPAYLNIDAALVYALDGKTDLTTADTQIDSPYNTYKNTGLTPGAISNPGLASLQAALDPADTDYFFYVLDPAAGNHYFSSTLDEHEAFRASLE